MPTVAPALLMFHPERWGQVDKFIRLHNKTYSFAERDRRALSGVTAHFGKAMRLKRLAERLAPNIEQDRAELDARGHTAAENAREVATLIEAAIIELYASVDCTVKVLRAIYGASTRSFSNSTRKTFQSVDRLSGEFPGELKALIRGAAWYGRLLRLRDDLTHLDTGSVHWDTATGVIRYDHFGMKEDDKRLSIEDVFAWLSVTEGELNAFLGAVFHHLNDTLIDEPVFQMCGMVDGRVLHRYVSPVGHLTFDSGSCGAWVWFEKPDMPTCPFIDSCGAYLRKAQPQG